MTRFCHAPLVLAASAGNADDVPRVCWLLDEGADVNDGSDSRTALQAAAGGGHTEVLRMLLEAPDIDVNTVDEGEGTALQAAAG